MNVELSEIVKKYKELMAEMQYELIAHKIAVDVLERQNEVLNADMEEVRLELQRLKLPKD